MLGAESVKQRWLQMPRMPGQQLAAGGEHHLMGPHQPPRGPVPLSWVSCIDRVFRGSLSERSTCSTPYTESARLTAPNSCLPPSSRQGCGSYHEHGVWRACTPRRNTTRPPLTNKTTNYLHTACPHKHTRARAHTHTHTHTCRQRQRHFTE